MNKLSSLALALVAAGCAHGPPKAVAPRLISAVLVTDCGADSEDQLAIANAVLNPAVDVRAILTTHASGMGAQSAQATAECARGVLAKLPPGKTRPPVITGANAALADKDTAVASFAVVALRSLAMQFNSENPLHVVLIAPATDVASALIIDPQMANRVVVNAKALDDSGGGEAWNARNDVAAWRVLLASHVPISISSNEAKGSLIMSQAQAAVLLSGTPLGDVLKLPAAEARQTQALQNDMTFTMQPNGTLRWVVDTSSAVLWNSLAAVTSAQTDATQ